MLVFTVPGDHSRGVTICYALLISNAGFYRSRRSLKGVTICYALLISNAGPLWTVVERCGALWTVVDRCGPLWTVVDCCGPLWIVVDCCGLLWKLWTSCELLWTIVDCCGPFSETQKDSERLKAFTEKKRVTGKWQELLVKCNLLSRFPFLSCIVCPLTGSFWREVWREASLSTR